ncbi:MAG: MATE family efflux transporter [Desulfobacterales bacterium]|nr:MATE family efflux transporter [Desulfobacterales bacterium]
MAQPTTQTNKSAYRQVIAISLPLAMSMAATTVMEFTDRVFLANHSLEAIAAVVPAGITAFLFIAFFLGVAGYVNVFIAQYIGAGAHHRVGACLWQGIWFTLFASVALSALVLIAQPLFGLVGHAPEVQRQETIYFSILCGGGGLNVATAALACFFSGRGYTRPVMAVSFLGMLFNIPLDYALINGLWIFPEMGIAGAGIATVSAWGLMTLVYCLLIFTKKNRARYNLWSGRGFDHDLFSRLLKFGVPGSLQFCLDVFAFTFFILMVGRIDKHALTATNIVFSINSLAFMPAMGFSMGVSTLTGQALGRNRPADAVRAANSSIHLLLAYIFLLDLVFIFAPHWILSIFMETQKASPAGQEIIRLGVILLRIVAGYVCVDALYMVYSGVLKGAGDTKYLMLVIGSLSLVCMVLPVTIGVLWFGTGLFFAWGCVVLFIVALFLMSWWRYLGGKWKTMRVIEYELSTEATDNDDELPLGPN